MQKFYSNGKLLITGEYLVLDGALALAVPTKLGQTMTVEELEKPEIIWKSLDEKDTIWFEDVFLMKDLKSARQNHPNEISQRLIQVLDVVKQLNPQFLETGKGYKITTKLNFPRDWGLGTSSTLINNIADWASIDPFKLLDRTFGGSGYDIACAQHDSAITYQRKKNNPIVNEVNFHPSFKEHLYFLYLNKKQNSREGIARYKTNENDLSREILDVSEITLKMIHCTDFNEFQELINAHETIISKIIQQTPVKQKLFSDFNGSIKSLGAWGGDFVMVASEEDPSSYFQSKGFETLLPYKELIK